MELQAILITATAAVGFISFCKSLVTFLRWCWITFFRPPKDLKNYGSWALITGATGGIGTAFVNELASKGLNLILVDRDGAKLEDTCNDICKKYSSKLKVKYLVMDFMIDSNSEIVRKIEEVTSGIDVGLLINNAGMTHNRPKYFNEIESSLIDEIIRVNIEGATWITKAVLPAMLKKKKGAIVNMGSGSGSSSMVSSLPLFSLYAATKAYMAMFSRSLSLEYKKNGIDIQCQTPFFVETKLTPMTRSSFFVPPADVFGRAAVSHFGYEYICMAHWTHCLQRLIQCSLPDALVDRIALGSVLSLRKKGVLRTLGYTL